MAAGLRNCTTNNRRPVRTQNATSSRSSQSICTRSHTTTAQLPTTDSDPHRTCTCPCAVQERSHRHATGGASFARSPHINTSLRQYTAFPHIGCAMPVNTLCRPFASMRLFPPFLPPPNTAPMAACLYGICTACTISKQPVDKTSGCRQPEVSTQHGALHQLKAQPAQHQK